MSLLRKRKGQAPKRIHTRFGAWDARPRRPVVLVCAECGWRAGRVRKEPFRCPVCDEARFPA